MEERNLQASNGAESQDDGESSSGPSTIAPPTEASSSSSTSSPPAQPTCTKCTKAETDPEKPLKPCNKCQSVRYCSRECQKADFKTHKKVCAAAAQEYAKSADLRIVRPAAPKKEGHRGGLQKWQFDT